MKPFVLATKLTLRMAKERNRSYPAQTIKDADVNNAALIGNTPTQAESLLQSLERAAGGRGIHVNADKTESKRQYPHTKRLSSETSGQIYLPRRQRLINRE